MQREDDRLNYCFSVKFLFNITVIGFTEGGGSKKSHSVLFILQVFIDAQSLFSKVISLR